MICMDNLTDYFALVSNVAEARGKGSAGRERERGECTLQLAWQAL